MPMIGTTPFDWLNVLSAMYSTLEIWSKSVTCELVKIKNRCRLTHSAYNGDRCIKNIYTYSRWNFSLNFFNPTMIMIPNYSYLKTMRPNYFMYQKLSLKINNQHIHKHILFDSNLLEFRSSEMTLTSMFNMIKNKLPWNNLNIIIFNTFHCHCQSYYNINMIN